MTRDFSEKAKQKLEGMLMEVTDHAGRKVKLEYDGGMLKTVTTPSGAVYTYSYGDNGRTRLKNHYDSKGKLTGTTDAAGKEASKNE